MRKASLPEKINILEQWFVEIGGSISSNVTIQDIGQLLVSKGLTNDIDSGIKCVAKLLKISNMQRVKDMSYSNDDFNKIFVQPVFKESLS